MKRIWLLISLVAFVFVGMGVAINGELEKALLEKLATEPSGGGAVEGRIYYNTAEKKAKLHNGTSFVGLGSGGSAGVNYIDNYDFESTADGVAPSDWVVYADAAGTTPVDGTGGSGNITFLGENTSPLRDSISAIVTKDAADRQGEGISYDIVIDPADNSKLLAIKFDYLASSAFADDDITVHVYNVDAASLIDVSGSITTDGKQFYGTFMTDDADDDYRLILHVASDNASAYTLQIDSIELTPGSQVMAPDPRWPSYDESEVTITPTGGSGGFVAGTHYLVPYQTAQGVWRLIGNGRFTHTGTTTDIQLAFSGTVFDSTISQAVLVGYPDSNGFAILNDDYILIQHSTSRAATTYSFDVALASKPTWATKPSPDMYLAGMPDTEVLGSDWTAFTPTFSNTTNMTSEAYYRRYGDSMQIKAQAVWTGAGGSAAGWSLTIPNSEVINALFTSNSDQNNSFGLFQWYDASDAKTYIGNVVYSNTTSVRFWTTAASAVINSSQFASGDKFNVFFTVPIQGWTWRSFIGNAIVGFNEATATRPGLVSSEYLYEGTPSGILTGTTVTDTELKIHKSGKQVTLQIKFIAGSGASGSVVTFSSAIPDGLKPEETTSIMTHAATGGAYTDQLQINSAGDVVIIRRDWGGTAKAYTSGTWMHNISYIIE